MGRRRAASGCFFRLLAREKVWPRRSAIALNPSIDRAWYGLGLSLATSTSWDTVQVGIAGLRSRLELSISRAHRELRLLQKQEKNLRPQMPSRYRADAVEPLELGFVRVIARYGFMENPSIPDILKRGREQGLQFQLMSTSFFLGRETLIPSKKPGMAMWPFSSWKVARMRASAMAGLITAPP
mgnify:CR=1 FL=1